MMRGQYICRSSLRMVSEHGMPFDVKKPTENIGAQKRDPSCVKLHWFNIFVVS